MTHPQKHTVNNNNFKDGLHSFKSNTNVFSNNNIKKTKSKKNVQISYVSFIDDKNNTYLDKSKLIENKLDETLKKTYIIENQSQNTNRQNYWKSKQKKAQNQNKMFISNNQSHGLSISSVKYRTVRTPGCWRPMFMFINRGSHIRAVTLTNAITTEIPHFTFTKKYDGLICHENNCSTQYVHNYSMI